MPRRKTDIFTQMAGARADYEAAKNTRFTSKLTGVASTGSGADYHYRSERQYLHMLERARELCRNDIIVGSGLKRLCANVLQDGFTIDPQTNDAGLDAELKARWYDWANDPLQCHSEGEFNFAAIEWLTLFSTLRDGDMLHLPLRDGSLQAVEGHRLRTPRNTKRDVVHGVMLDKRARRTEYWVTKQELDPWRAVQRVSDVQRYPARDQDGNRRVLHVYMPDRFSQRRGVTAFAPIATPAGMHDDVQFATLVKQQMSSLIAIFRERSADGEYGTGSTPMGPVDEETGPEGGVRQIAGLQAGLEFTGDPGEKLHGFAPDIPSAQYFEHSHLLLTFIAVNLDLPAAVLLLDPSKTNFSGWRGAIDQARIRFRQMQRWMIGAFHTPVYKWKVRQWMARDPVLREMVGRPGINPFGHRWNPPTWQYIEPMKDASADLLQQRNGLNSPRRIQAQRGRDWDEISREIVEDNRHAIEIAIKAASEINATYAHASVHWRELISLPTPDGVSLAIGNEPANQGGGDD